MPILDLPLSRSMAAAGGSPGYQDAYNRILAWEATMDRRRNTPRMMRLRDSWLYYTGDILTEGDYVQPLQINYVQSTCEAHASYLWGQWEPQDRIISWTIKPRKGKGDQEKMLAISEWIDSLFVGYEDLFYSAGLNQSIFGSGILRPRWNPLYETIIPESILPEQFHCRWSAHDINDITDAILAYPIDRDEAYQQYKVRGDPSYSLAVKGYSAKYAIFWEHWTKDRHSIWIDNYCVVDEENPTMTDDTPGIIPFVHIPNVRPGGEFYGQSDIEPVLRLQDELNRKMADQGDIISYAAHPIILVQKYYGKVSNLPIGPDSIWDMGREGEAKYLDGGTPPVDINAYVDRLMAIFQDLSHMPAAAFGRSETAQASALALAMEMMPVTQRVNWKRLHWKQGVIQYVHAAARIADAYDVLPFSLEDFQKYTYIPSFAPILPKDRAAQIGENISLVSAGLRTIVRALEDMGDKDAAVEAEKIIDELTRKMKLGLLAPPKPLQMGGKNGNTPSGGSPDSGSETRDSGKG